MVVVSLLAAVGDARADGGEGNVQTKPSFWRSGPAGGAFGFFVEGGATAGTLIGYAFGAGSLGIGMSLHWFEASFTGYYGSSFDSLDGPYAAGGFVGRVALRVPARYVAFSLGSELGDVAVVSGHPVFTNVAVVEPLSIGLEIDPVCHLRIGLLGVFGDEVVRGALTVGYVMGPCSKR